VGAGGSARASPRTSIAFNDWVTLFKVAGIIGIIVAAIGFGTGNTGNLLAVRGDGAMLGAPTAAALATSLVFVMFCYAGWNAAAYLGGELVTPQRTLPWSLLLGTVLVAALYLALNMVYFYGAPMEAMAGKVG
jgi:APA family basic amino acid/polyamine antiporter